MGVRRGKAGYIDKSGAFIINPRFDEALSFSEGLATVKIGNKWGHVNKLYEVKTGDFSEGLAPACIVKKCGYIDTSGEWAIKPQVDLVLPFAGGVARIYIKADLGYIDKTGRYIWSPSN